MKTKNIRLKATEKGSALLVVIIIGFIIASTSMLTLLSTRHSTKRVSSRREIVSAFNIAEAGKEHAISLVRSGMMFPVEGSCLEIFLDKAFEGGTYSVTYDAKTHLDTIWIYSLGTLGGRNAQVNVVCALNRDSTEIDADIGAAVTTRSNADVTGSIIIDGRDWNIDGDSIVADGVYGVKSCSDITCDPGASIGGNGKAPTCTLSTENVLNNASSAGYPQTPEEVLGVPPGSLDQYKTTTLPSMPFNGIVYYIPEGTFICPDLDGSQGIFIVHNEDRIAEIKNISGEFKGLLIADRVDHILATAELLGAVVTLSEVSGTNAFGLGNATIRYSSAVINNVVNTFKVVSDTTVEVVSWQQVE